MSVISEEGNSKQQNQSESGIPGLWIRDYKITLKSNNSSVPVNSRFTTNAASVFVLYLVGIMLYCYIGNLVDTFSNSNHSRERLNITNSQPTTDVQFSVQLKTNKCNN